MRRGGCIQTFSGIAFWPLDPQPGDVRLDDLAHSLSLLCRYNGHCRWFYSVGHHSLLCAEEARLRGLSPRIQLLALLHDAAEAYVSDVTTPLKRYLLGFGFLERRVQRAVYRALDVRPPTRAEEAVVRDIDLTLLATEVRLLLRPGWWRPTHMPSRHITVIPELPAKAVEVAFKSRLRWLRQETLKERGQTA